MIALTSTIIHQNVLMSIPPPTRALEMSRGTSKINDWPNMKAKIIMNFRGNVFQSVNLDSDGWEQ